MLHSYVDDSGLEGGQLVKARPDMYRPASSEIVLEVTRPSHRSVPSFPAQNGISGSTSRHSRRYRIMSFPRASTFAYSNSLTHRPVVCRHIG